jgi:hypothetical protein
MYDTEKCPLAAFCGVQNKVYRAQQKVKKQYISSAIH